LRKWKDGNIRRTEANTRRKEKMSYATLYTKPKTGIDKKKEKYDRTLNKLYEVQAFIDDASLPYEAREKRTEEFKALAEELNRLILRIRAEGYEMTKDDIIKGFSTNTNITNITSNVRGLI